MVMGNLLAGRRIFLMDHLSMDAGVFYDQRFRGRTQATIRRHPLVDVFFRIALGVWRADVWPDHALFGNVARDGSGAGLLRGFRHSDAADFQSDPARDSRA